MVLCSPAGSMVNAQSQSSVLDLASSSALGSTVSSATSANPWRLEDSLAEARYRLWGFTLSSLQTLAALAARDTLTSLISLKTPVRVPFCSGLCYSEIQPHSLEWCSVSLRRFDTPLLLLH